MLVFRIINQIILNLNKLKKLIIPNFLFQFRSKSLFAFKKAIYKNFKNKLNLFLKFLSTNSISRKVIKNLMLFFLNQINL